MSNQDAAARSLEDFSPVERAAILLLSLGEEDAARVLRHMAPKEVHRIGVAMAGLSNLRNAEIETVLSHFLDVVAVQSGLALGANDYLRNMLVEALGEDKAKGFLDRILGGNTAGLDKLKWMDARAIADFIRYEHPQIKAIVLAYLDPDQSAEVMRYFPDDESRTEVLIRIAKLEAIQPSALQELNAVLEAQVNAQTTSRFANLGGVKAAAEIMNNVDGRIEQALMAGIEEADAALSAEIQELMFIFDNLVDVDDAGIQALLREISSEHLILALKGADKALQDKIFANMSKRAAELLRDDLEAKGPVRLSDVEAAQKEILAVARRMAEAGEIMLGAGAGDELV